MPAHSNDENEVTSHLNGFELDVWKGLSEEVREMVMEMHRRATTKANVRYDQGVKSGKDDMRKSFEYEIYGYRSKIGKAIEKLEAPDPDIAHVVKDLKSLRAEMDQ